MRKVLQTIVRDTERYSISNSSELSLSKPDLYIEKIALQGGETATTDDIVVTRSGTLTEYEPYLPPKSLTFSRDYLLSLKGVNNLLDKSKFPATQTINGITFTNNGDGTITVDGTAGTESSFAIFRLNGEDITIQKSRQYLMMGCASNGSTGTYFLRDGWNSIKPDIGNGRISSSIGTKLAPMIQVFSGTTVSNLVFKPALYDLTAIYGEGNEPTTVEQFLKDYPLSSTDKLTITKNSVKYNDTDITSEVTGLDEFFSIDADVSTITTSANIALGEITEDIAYSVKSNKRAVYTGEDVIYSSQTFIMSDIVTTTYNAKGKVFLTKSQFDARKAAGTLQAGTEYMIIDKG